MLTKKKAWENWTKAAPALAQVALDQAIEALAKEPENPGLQWARGIKKGFPPNLYSPELLEPGLGWEAILAAKGDLQATGLRRWLPSINLELVWVPPGNYLRGNDDDPQSPHYDENAWADEHPARLVTIKNGFWLGKYPVTCTQIEAFHQANQTPLPQAWARTQGGDHPACFVDWFGAVQFCGWLSRTHTIRCRLPTEAEWEWAARGPESYRYPWGNGMVKPNRVWYGKGVKESDDKRIPTSPAGLRPLGAGPFGAQDQAGNCWEWCLDSWTNPWKEQIPPDTDLFKWLQHQGKHHTRTIRGGSWKVAVASLRAACRASETSGKEEEATGFRVVVEE